jgi:hypothetical protein
MNIKLCKKLLENFKITLEDEEDEGPFCLGLDPHFETHPFSLLKEEINIIQNLIKDKKGKINSEYLYGILFGLTIARCSEFEEEFEKFFKLE